MRRNDQLDHGGGRQRHAEISPGCRIDRPSLEQRCLVHHYGLAAISADTVFPVGVRDRGFRPATNQGFRNSGLARITTQVSIQILIDVPRRAGPAKHGEAQSMLNAGADDPGSPSAHTAKD